MRIALRVGIAVLLVSIVGLGLLALALPRIAASDAVQERIRRAAHDATGAEVGFEALSFGLVPPRLVVTRPEVKEPGRADPVARAESVDLELQLLPLFARTVVVDSLVVEGAQVRLVRTEQGLEIPLQSSPSAADPAPAPSGEPGPPASPESGDAAGFQLALVGLELRSAQIVLEDRAVSPAVTWELVDVDVRAKGRSLESPIDIEGKGRLTSGGQLQVQGTADLEGRLDLTLKLDGIALAPASPYAGFPELGGTVTGRVIVKGPAAALASLDAELFLEEAALAVEDLQLNGRLALQATLAGTEGGLGGPFEIDASDAAVLYGEFFHKPPGNAATVSGRLVPEAGSFVVEDVHLKVEDFEAKGRLRSGTRSRLQLDAPPFEVAGIAALVPPLASLAPRGRLALEEVSVVTEPLALSGRIPILGLLLSPGAGEPLELRGALEAQGTALRSSELVARVGGQPVRLDLRLTGLGTDPRVRMRANTDQADLPALLRAFGADDEIISGPLTASADLTGPLASEAGLLTAVRGRVQLAVGRGRLRGVSLLRGTVERLGTLGDVALALGAVQGGRTLQRFYEDEFESITGSFDVAGGKARSHDLQLVYRHYQVDLDGSLGLADTALDFKGQLTIQPEVDAALSGGGVARDPGREKVIPLAHVGGTLGSPRIELTREAVLALAASPRRGKLESEIDERLGEGSGREVLDALEGLFGGGKR
ncbi:MAG: AsmA-like C-terminal region-containing protein [Myxococcota bacterium]